ncbi:unnamed protein product [Closterium sp. NIES-54]
MARGDDYDDEVEEDDEEYEEEEEEEEEYEEERGKKRGRGSQFIDDAAEEDEDEDEEDEAPRKKKGSTTGRSMFIEEEAAVASDDEEEEEEEEDGFIDRDEDLGNERPSAHHRIRCLINPPLYLLVATPLPGFIDRDADLGEELGNERPSAHHRTLLRRNEEEEEVNEEDYQRFLEERYARNEVPELGEGEATEVEQQALLPSVRDPKLWMVKCELGHEGEAVVSLMQKCVNLEALGQNLQIKSVPPLFPYQLIPSSPPLSPLTQPPSQLGHEREAVVSLMQKCVNLEALGQNLQIKSAIALDNLKGCVYVEAYKEAYVKEVRWELPHACTYVCGASYKVYMEAHTKEERQTQRLHLACAGLRLLRAWKPALVPIKEMAGVLTVEQKSVDLEENSWVRVKIGLYKGDLALCLERWVCEEEEVIGRGSGCGAECHALLEENSWVRVKIGLY